LGGVGRLHGEFLANLIHGQFAFPQGIQDGYSEGVCQRFEEIRFEIAQWLPHPSLLPTTGANSNVRIHAILIASVAGSQWLQRSVTAEMSKGGKRRRDVRRGSDEDAPVRK
jgi:hypothetical protein